MTLTSRRNFIKSAGLLTAATALINPFDLFAQSKSKSALKGGSKKMVLTFRPYDAQMRHIFTIANSSRTTTPIVLTEIEWDGVVGYGEAALPPYLGETQNSVIDFLKKEKSFGSDEMIIDSLDLIDTIFIKTKDTTLCKKKYFYFNNILTPTIKVGSCDYPKHGGRCLDVSFTLLSNNEIDNIILPSNITWLNELNIDNNNIKNIYICK